MEYHKEEIKKLLEKAYELEGLLLLALNREEPPVEIGILISQKCEEISRGAVDALASPVQDSEPESVARDEQPATSIEPVPEENPEEIEEVTEEIEDGPEELEESPEEIEDDTEGIEEEFEETEDIEESEDTEEPLEEEDLDDMEETEEIDDSGELEPQDENDDDDDENENVDVNENENVPVDEDDFDDGTFYTLEDEEPYRPKIKPDETPAPQPTAAIGSPDREMSQPAREAPKFSINDKFLFIREIFKGNAAEFNEAIERMRTFQDAQQAEEYYVDTLKLDPEDPAASHFLDTVRTYFKQ